MSNYEATRYDFDGQFIQDLELVNTGLIIPWSDSVVPSGFLECNGQTISRTTFSNLFAVIGTTYGSGNGSTTFEVPDLTDRTVVGKSGTKALASTGGANTVSSTGNVSGSAANTTLTTPEIAAHTHPHTSGSPGGARGDPGPGQKGGGSTSTQPTGGGGAHSHNLTANFTGNATSVLQPFTTLIYIIKT
jgi:microcystin-dependent protein